MRAPFAPTLFGRASRRRSSRSPRICWDGPWHSTQCCLRIGCTSRAKSTFAGTCAASVPPSRNAHPMTPAHRVNTTHPSFRRSQRAAHATLFFETTRTARPCRGTRIVLFPRPRDARIQPTQRSAGQRCLIASKDTRKALFAYVGHVPIAHGRSPVATVRRERLMSTTLARQRVFALPEATAFLLALMWPAMAALAVPDEQAVGPSAMFWVLLLPPLLIRGHGGDDRLCRRPPARRQPSGGCWKRSGD